jgi:hypothetical protein
MSMPTARTPEGLAGIQGKVPPPSAAGTEGLLGVASLDEQTEKRIDDIELIGEEAAAWRRTVPSEVSAGMRYLHISRTINQLVNDRNRAVGVYLAVASLMWTGSGAVLNAKPNAQLIVPIETIQRACLPATFGTLAVLALFVSFLLIRTRIGLIYEVAKMNALLGLPVGRVQRVNALSIFFIMHSLISLAGGFCGAIFVYHLLVDAGARPGKDVWIYSLLIGLAIVVVLQGLYVGTVLYTTADRKLQATASG